MSDSPFAWDAIEALLLERKHRRRIIVVFACICLVLFFARVDRTHERNHIARADIAASTVVYGRDGTVNLVKRRSSDDASGTSSPQKKRKVPPPPPQPAARPPPRRIDWWAEYKDKQRNRKLHPPAPNSMHGAQKPLGAAGGSKDEVGSPGAGAREPGLVNNNKTTVPPKRNRPFGKPQTLVSGKQRPQKVEKAASRMQNTPNDPPRAKQTPDVSTPSRVATKATSARPNGSASKSQVTPAPDPHIRPPMSSKDEDPNKHKFAQSFFSAISTLRHMSRRRSTPYTKTSFHCQRGCTGQGCCQSKDDELDEEAYAAMPMFMGAHICAHDTEL